VTKRSAPILVCIVLAYTAGFYGLTPVRPRPLRAVLVALLTLACGFGGGRVVAADRKGSSANGNDSGRDSG
jgi:hypothetical protein